MEQANPGGYATVTVELNTSLARVPIAIFRVARFVIGEGRAVRIAERACMQLARWRVKGQRRWSWLAVPSLWLRTWTMAVFVVIPTVVAATGLVAAGWLLWEVCRG